MTFAFWVFYYLQCGSTGSSETVLGKEKKGIIFPCHFRIFRINIRSRMFAICSKVTWWKLHQSATSSETFIYEHLQKLLKNCRPINLIFIFYYGVSETVLSCWVISRQKQKTVEYKNTKNCLLVFKIMLRSQSSDWATGGRVQDPNAGMGKRFLSETSKRFRGLPTLLSMNTTVISLI